MLTQADVGQKSFSDSRLPNWAKFYVELGSSLSREHADGRNVCGCVISPFLGFTATLSAVGYVITFQQIQKYERGANRIGASRVFEFSRLLDVPVSFFFDDMPKELDTHEGRFAAGLRDKNQPYETDPLARRETLELVRAYYKIPDPRVRKRLFETAKALAKMENID